MIEDCGLLGGWLGYGKQTDEIQSGDKKNISFSKVIAFLNIYF
jgi:hypothetical protein